jgi:hypothetical protein
VAAAAKISYNKKTIVRASGEFNLHVGGCQYKVRFHARELTGIRQPGPSARVIAESFIFEMLEFL